MTFQKGDRVLLLSVPFSSQGNATEAEGVGEVHDITGTLNHDGESWFTVAGWFVRAENIRKADD